MLHLAQHHQTHNDQQLQNKPEKRPLKSSCKNSQLKFSIENILKSPASFQLTPPRHDTPPKKLTHTWSETNFLSSTQYFPSTLWQPFNGEKHVKDKLSSTRDWFDKPNNNYGSNDLKSGYNDSNIRFHAYLNALSHKLYQNFHLSFQTSAHQSSHLNTPLSNRKAVTLDTELLSPPTTLAYSSSSSEEEVDVDSLDEEQENKINLKNGSFKTENKDLDTIKNEQIVIKEEHIEKNEVDLNNNANVQSFIDENKNCDKQALKNHTFEQNQMTEYINIPTTLATKDANIALNCDNKKEIISSCSTIPSNPTTLKNQSVQSSPNVFSTLTPHFNIVSPTVSYMQQKPSYVQSSNVATKKKGRGHYSLPYDLPRVNGKFIYECKTCGKICAQLSNLKVHLLTHTGERPFSCNQCPSRFTQKAHLIKHLSTHTGLKPFSCNICGKRSSSSSNIKAHMKIHENKKIEIDSKKHNEIYKSSATVKIGNNNKESTKIVNTQNYNKIYENIYSNILLKDNHKEAKSSYIYLPYSTESYLNHTPFLNAFKNTSDKYFFTNNKYQSNFEQNKYFQKFQKIDHQKQYSNTQYQLQQEQHKRKRNRFFPYNLFYSSHNTFNTITPIINS